MCHSSCARLLTSTSTTRTAGSCRCASSQAVSTSTSDWVFIMGSSTIEFGHRGAGRGVDDQAEDVAAAVVANRIELLAADPGPGRVDLGVEHAFLAGQRARQYVPFGADDDGVAAGQPVAAVAVQAVAAGQVRGQVGGADAGGDADDVGAALPGDVPQGRHPDLGVVPGGRQVDVDALGVQGGPGQGHVVLPADQPAEPAESGVDDLQGR